MDITVKSWFGYQGQTFGAYMSFPSLYSRYLLLIKVANSVFGNNHVSHKLQFVQTESLWKTMICLNQKAREGIRVQNGNKGKDYEDQFWRTNHGLFVVSKPRLRLKTNPVSSLHNNINELVGFGWISFST